jgi:internalin A
MCLSRNDPHFYEFDVLRKFASDGQPFIQCQKSYEMVRVMGLIDDVREITQSNTKPKADIPGFTFNAPIERVIIEQAGASGMTHHGENQTAASRPTSAWANGSFYIFLFVVVFAVLGFAAQALPLYALALIIIAGILLIPLIGALQLRQDRTLSDKSFMELIRIVIGQLPLLSRFARSEPLPAGSADEERRARVRSGDADELSTPARRRAPGRQHSR